MKLIWAICAVLIGGLLWQSPHASAQSAASEQEVILLPFPDRIEPLKAPVNAMLSYGKATTRCPETGQQKSRLCSETICAMPLIPMTRVGKIPCSPHQTQLSRPV